MAFNISQLDSSPLLTFHHSSGVTDLLRILFDLFKQLRAQ